MCELRIEYLEPITNTVIPRIDQISSLNERDELINLTLIPHQNFQTSNISNQLHYTRKTVSTLRAQLSIIYTNLHQQIE